MSIFKNLFKQPTLEELIARKDARGIARLLAHGDFGDPLRDQAAAALVNLGESAIPALAEAVTDPERSALASASLKQLGWTPTNDDAGAMYWIAQRDFTHCVSIGAPAVMPLLRILWEETAQPDLLARASEALASIGQPAIGSLLTMLPSKVTGERAAACLAKIAPEVVVPPLLEFILDADNRGIKTGLKNGITAMAAIGEPAVPALEASLAAHRLDPATYRTIMAKVHPEAS